MQQTQVSDELDAEVRVGQVGNLLIVKRAAAEAFGNHFDIIENYSLASQNPPRLAFHRSSRTGITIFDLSAANARSHEIQCFHDFVGQRLSPGGAFVAQPSDVSPSAFRAMSFHFYFTRVEKGRPRTVTSRHF